MLGVGALSAGIAFEPMPVRAETTPSMFTTAPASFADVVEKVSGAVVSIYVQGGRGDDAVAGLEGQDLFPDLPDDHPLNEFFKRFKKDRSSPAEPEKPSLAQGSGFVISADGYVVTNNHVVSDAKKIEVAFDENSKLEAELVGTDPRTDLALIKIKDPGGRTFATVPFAKQSARVGDWVLAIGNPFGLGGTVTAGIVSARGRDIGSGPYDFLQIDAAVNRGNSGGPAFNLAGEVIGINTAIFSPSGGNVGIAFAVPSEVAQVVIEQLKSSGTVNRGWLGVHIQNVTDDIAQSLGMASASGALVTKITESGPAAGTGLEVGDTIVSVDGSKVESSRDLARRIAEMQPGHDTKLMVLRDGKEMEIAVKLGLFPSDTKLAKLDQSAPGVPETQDLNGLGLSLAPSSTLGADAAAEGVLITKVAGGSEAADKGLSAGDIIVEVAGEKVLAPSDVAKGVADAKGRGRKAVLFRIKSGGEERFIALSLDKS